MRGRAGPGFDIEPGLAFLLFGGPVLVCAVGAVAGVVMSAGQRGREVMTLAAVGATPRLCLGAAIEALVHVANAALDPVPLLAVFAAGPTLVTRFLATLTSLYGKPVLRVE